MSRYCVRRASALSNKENKPCKNAYWSTHHPLRVGAWYVDINTLEELNDLHIEVGDEIVYGYGQLLIYDDHIE